MSERSSPKQLEHHDPRLVDASIEKAQQFYEYDHQLNTADRRKLSKYFWQKMIISPLFGLPVSFLFVMAPNLLKKRGILFNPQKKHRFLQVMLGFVGLGIGERLGGSVASSVHMSMLSDNDAARNAYRLLSIYPSQLGSRYYSMTALTPAMALKDPRTIDWNSNPLFPICLVMSQDIIVQLRKAEHDRIDNYRARQEAHKQNQIAQRSHATESKDSSELTGTSWDSIIQSQDQQNYGKQSNVNQDQKHKPQDQGRGSINNENDWELNSLPNSNRDGHQEDIKIEQIEFDKLIEQDRNQAQDDFKDDFIESEKKW